jgi:hypothetical protein
MKLSEYIKHLNTIYKKYPDLDVIYASDDEGNTFRYVVYIPSIGIYDKDADEFDALSDSRDINAVCVN